MDTKSKNIKQSKLFKTVALVLAIVLFFLAGNFASLFIKGFANFNIFSNPEDFTQTFTFRRQMNQYIMAVADVGRSSNYQSLDDFLKSDEAKSYSEKYEEQAAGIEAAYKQLDGSEIEIYVDAQNRYRYALTHKGVRYFFNCGGTLISKSAFDTYDYVEYEETGEVVTAVDSNASEPQTNGAVLYHDPAAGGGVPEYIKLISAALEEIHDVDGHRDYGESNKKIILDQIEGERVIYLENIYYTDYRSHMLREFRSVKSINYAVFYKNSDKVFTNCGVTATDTQEQIREKLNVTSWAECTENGKYRLIAGEKDVAETDVYATLHEWLFGTSTESILQSDIDYAYMSGCTKAYFSFNEDCGETDVFTSIKKSFDSYGKGHSLTAYFALTFVSFALACAICIYLLSVAGKTADGIKINFFDKVPLEINWLLGLAVMAGAAVVAGAIVVYELFPFSLASYNNDGNKLAYTVLESVTDFTNIIEGICVSAFFMIWTGLNASLLRNIRNKTFFKHSIVFFCLRPIKWIFKKLWKGSKKTAEKIGYVFANDYAKGGLKFKVLACVAISAFVVLTPVYYIIAMACLFDVSEFIGIILFLLGIAGDLAILGFAILCIVSLDRIMHGVSDMRSGKLGQGINQKFMPPFLKRFADDVLFMQDGLEKAVDTAVKDQRMKAELITNVSHDLKTPLTSIVNYVDLLKKCEIEDETAQRYVSILDEKSHKMKKLIEDLVEASKASSGAIEIHPVKLNLCEFAAQTVGEHEDELKKYNLELVLKMPETPVTVVADAQKTSRIAENLFSNIRKYALAGTRVYAEVVSGIDYSMITFKNVSKHQLDVSAEELTQRFVRGDASRSGEGSGLGLSIAKDLCELQGGKLLIQTDGDLFKVTVALPTAKD